LPAILLLAGGLGLLVGLHGLLPASGPAAGGVGLLAGLGWVAWTAGAARLVLAAVADGAGRRSPWRSSAVKLAVAPVELAAVAAIYVVPVLTVPLLPVGLLTAGCFRWPVVRPGRLVRAVGAVSEEFAGLWLALLLWGGLGVGGGVILHRLMAGLAAEAMTVWLTAVIHALGAVLIVIVAGLFGVTAARCVGLFGHVWFAQLRRDAHAR
jgi:hypothetical protein